MLEQRDDVCSNESYEHRRGKIILQQLLENKTLKYVDRGDYVVKINYPSQFTVKQEHRLEDNKRADVALIDSSSNKVVYIFEVYHTHRVKHRPGEWFEFSAVDIKENSAKLKDMRKLFNKVPKIKCGICNEWGYKVCYKDCNHFRCDNCAKTNTTCSYCSGEKKSRRKRKYNKK